MYLYWIEFPSIELNVPLLLIKSIPTHWVVFIFICLFVFYLLLGLILYAETASGSEQIQQPQHKPEAKTSGPDKRRGISNLFITKPEEYTRYFKANEGSYSSTNRNSVFLFDLNDSFASNIIGIPSTGLLSFIVLDGVLHRGYMIDTSRLGVAESRVSRFLPINSLALAAKSVNTDFQSDSAPLVLNPQGDKAVIHRRVTNCSNVPNISQNTRVTVSSMLNP